MNIDIFSGRLVKIAFLSFLISLFIFRDSFSEKLLLDYVLDSENEITTEWLVYDNNDNLYVPYLPEIHQNIKSVSLIVSQNKFREKKFTIKASEDYNVFLNNKLHHQIFSGQSIINLDSLFKHIEEEELLLTLYNESGIDKLPYVNVIEENKLDQKTEPGKSLKRKDHSYLRDLTVLFLILFLFIFGSIYQRKNPLNDFLSTDSIISDLQKRQLNDSKISLNTFVVFVIYCSLIFPIVIFVLGERFDIPILNYLSSYLKQGFFSMDAALGFLYLFFLAVIFFLIKFIITLALGTVYKIRNNVNIHLMEYIKVTGLLFSFMLFFSFLLILYSGNITNNLIKYFLLLLICVYFLFLGIRLNKLFVFNKFYLISYFCITEFIPIFLSLKFFIKF
ncbi:DUF4271 domain-containing protein [Flexithrix dorotheae]|uniref:DUF4271 domain-containing protein n=1 Tax=Flexithrix dorotheae TaxID=70993 RepID=UPI00036DA9A2|nr:DUF4271 domain-containing protein [Flexithrix dorotheae]